VPQSGQRGIPSRGAERWGARLCASSGASPCVQVENLKANLREQAQEIGRLRSEMVSSPAGGEWVQGAAGGAPITR